MFVGLKINTHFIINCVPEREVNGYFVMNNLKECLHELDFNVRDSSVTTTLVMCLRTWNCFHTMELIHLIYISHLIVSEYIMNSVHLMKSIRNNLHNHKRLLFPPYDFEEFNDGICVPADEIRWQIFVTFTRRIRN